MFFNATEELGIKMKILFWNHTTCNVHFCHSLVVVAFNNVHDLVNRQFPALVTVFDKAGIRTERAGIHADIRRLYVKIMIKINVVPAFFLPDIICQNT